MSNLRLLHKYPFEEIIDDRETHRGRTVIRYRNETSLLQTLDLENTDDTIRRSVEKLFAPETVSYLSADEANTDNVFECLNPLTSRYASDRCLRQQIFDELSSQLSRKLEAEKDQKEKKDLKEKYDLFIQSLSK